MRPGQRRQTHACYLIVPCATTMLVARGNTSCRGIAKRLPACAACAAMQLLPAAPSPCQPCGSDQRDKGAEWQWADIVPGCGGARDGCRGGRCLARHLPRWRQAEYANSTAGASASPAASRGRVQAACLRRRWRGRRSFQRRWIHQYCSGARRMACSRTLVYHWVSARTLCHSGPPCRGSVRASRANS